MIVNSWAAPFFRDCPDSPHGGNLPLIAVSNKRMNCRTDEKLYLLTSKKTTNWCRIKEVLIHKKNDFKEVML